MSVKRIGLLFAAIALSAPLAATIAGGAGNFKDVLDVPASASPLATKSLLNGLAVAGKRVVAVGQRGHIVFSDDAGKTWRQATVPVSSDLVAVSFPTPQLGWAVGHDGVIVHSSDGGLNWSRQLDGRSAGKLMLDWYDAQAGKGALGNADDSARLLAEVKKIAAQGAENPFLDVWFADADNGFVVGAFNLIFRTADGGKTWEPWFHRTDNASRLHLYSVRGVGSDVYATGEQGLVLKLEAGGSRFRAVETPYKGSYFGVVGGSGEAVVVFGLRGNAFRSVDGGRSWSKVDTGVQDGLTGGGRLGERGLVLVSQSGRILVSSDAGASFAPLRLEQATPAAAVVAVGNDALAIAGARGVRIQPLQPPR